MNKHRQVLWAKMMLGGLTVADIRKYMGSEISFGSHWLNSVAMKKRKMIWVCLSGTVQYGLTPTFPCLWKQW
jgi:hypothetical protein